MTGTGQDSDVQTVGSRRDVRGRLQRAAFELYSERGYDGATTAEIAARAGVTERTFFRHFKDKREVVFAGEADLLAGLAEAVAAAPEGLRPMAVLLWTFRRFAVALEQNRAFNAPLQTIIEATPALRERQVAKTAAMTFTLASALQRRGVEESLARLAALTSTAVFDHASRAWYADGSVALDSHLERSLLALRDLSAST